MSNIKILELNLRNFKGIKKFKIAPGGEDLNIYGDNATGKTTLMDAFLWLLFDKDSSNSSNFNVKTLDSLGKPIHMLEHEVIAKLDVDSKVIELQKIYKEKWTKKRGQADSELTGHTTDYFINGVPKKLNEYKEYLAQIVDEDTFKILTNPLFFNRSLDWKSRRKIALDICGDLSISDVIDQDNKLIELKDLLVDKSIDDLKAEMASRRKKLNEELKSIPYRIDELSREVNAEIDVAALTKEKIELQTKLSDVKNSKGIDFDFQLRSIKGTINFLETEIKKIEQNLTQEIREEINKNYELKSKSEKELSEISTEIIRSSSKIGNLEVTKTNVIENMDDLRKSFDEISKLAFDEESTNCPTCHQGLPAETITSLNENFELDKANKLKNINAKGKELKAALIKLEEDITGLEINKDIIDKQKLELENRVNDFDNVIKTLQNELNNINILENREYREIKSKITSLNKEEVELSELSKQQDNTEQIVDLEFQIMNIDTDLARVNLAKENSKRVEELKVRERELSNMVVETEKIEFLCDQFLITKSNLLEDKLNSKFKIVRFKLFDVQVNGGISETFVTTVDGVPFEDLNNAMKINAGLDIIMTLSKQYDLVAPIFLDNRESVNMIPDMEAQVINLIVSKDKSLRMEVEK